LDNDYESLPYYLTYAFEARWHYVLRLTVANKFTWFPNPPTESKWCLSSLFASPSSLFNT